MVFCTYCGQEFQRNEHLQRHLTSHTNIKRFKCRVCHVSFSRADVLQRHILIHGEENPSPTRGNADRARRTLTRTRAACVDCARAKAKCDANTPCKRCTGKRLRCVRLRRPGSRRAADDSEHPSTLDSPNAVDTILAETNPEVETQERNEEADTRSQGTDGPPQDKTNDVRGDSLVLADDQPALRSEPYHGAIAEVSISSEIENTFNFPQLWQTDTDQPPEVATVNSPATDRWAGEIHTEVAQDAPPAGSIPIEIPGINGDMGNQVMAHTPWLTFPDMSFVAEHQAVIEAQEYWSYFRCNPTQHRSRCPRTGGSLISSLSHIPPSDDLWGWLGLSNNHNNNNTDGGSTRHIVMPIYEPVRDKLSAISQTCLRKALRVHCLDPAMVDSSSTPGSHSTRNADTSEGFLILPPAATIEHFLHEYMKQSESFYSLIPGGLLDVNTLMQGRNATHATILILLMISQGAMSESTAEARRLSGGLTEVCRISLFDTIEKSVSTSHQCILMHSAILFTIQAAWSGDKWLMDIGLGQRGIYMSLLRHANLFEIGDDHSNDDSMEAEDPKHHYFRWRDREMQVRLVYTWIILDLELSLFHDVKTVLSLTDFKLPVPISEELFLSKELAVGEFSLEEPPNIDIANHANRPSLQVMLQWLFKQGFDNAKRKHLNPTTLHVLLHAILSMIRNYRQLFGYMGLDARIRISVFSPFSKASTKTRMDEMRALLQYWLGLFNALWPSSTQHGDEDPCLPPPQLYAVLITYHFICLETVVDMPAIENLARQRLPDSKIAQMDTSLKDQYIQDLVPVLFHSGQILYLLRVLEQTSLPPWWPAAIYRVTMVLWAASVIFGSAWKQPSDVELSSPLIIDASLHDDDSNLAPLWQENSENYSVGVDGVGLNMSQLHTPALSVRGDMSNATPLSDPQRVLETCLLAFEKGRSIRFADGIYRKLKQFMASRTTE